MVRYKTRCLPAGDIRKRHQRVDHQAVSGTLVHITDQILLCQVALSAFVMMKATTAAACMLVLLSLGLAHAARELNSGKSRFVPLLCCADSDGFDEAFVAIVQCKPICRPCLPAGLPAGLPACLPACLRLLASLLMTACLRGD